MNGYDTREDERPRLLRAVGESDGGPVDLPLDRAANAARTEGLLAAACHLEELRKELVGRRLFQGWDEGILCLCSLFKIIRQMSSEAEVVFGILAFLACASFWAVQATA